jgi:hypothetical protein
MAPFNASPFGVLINALTTLGHRVLKGLIRLRQGI